MALPPVFTLGSYKLPQDAIVDQVVGQLDNSSGDFTVSTGATVSLSTGLTQGLIVGVEAIGGVTVMLVNLTNLNYPVLKGQTIHVGQPTQIFFR